MTDEKLQKDSKKDSKKESAIVEEDKQLSVESSLQVSRLAGHILLAVNSALKQELITNALEKTAATVELAENGQEALQKAISGQFDLILMDIQMPVMGGDEAMACLKQLGIDIPTIALTTNNTTADIEEYTAAGFSGTLSTPVNIAQLYRVLTQHLQNAVKENNPEEANLTHFIATTPKLKILFFTELRKQHAAIADSIENSNYNNLIKFIHVIKGTAGSLGYDDLTDMADHCLTLLRREQFEQGLQNCIKLNSKIASLISENDKRELE
jgi:CheY-like chemotaxis protein/HPt (histidine-containing phosphotransfer) domain-containing protein